VKIWFWQLIISPHMSDLVKALADKDVSVTLVVQQEMSADRAAQGWVAPDIGKAKLLKAATAEQMRIFAESAPADVIHICQGIRGNGVIQQAQKTLAQLKRKQFIVMETVDDPGWKGYLKRATYWYLFKRLNSSLTGILATGSKTKDWVIARGINSEKVFPFAYFLRENTIKQDGYLSKDDEPFRALFVGRIIGLKRIDLLMRAVSILSSKNVKLVVVGSGPLENELKELADKCIPDQIEWIGQLPMSDVRNEMLKSDCLILPSRHDGWGAVVSEALMSGTPAICSDTCGSACVVPRGKYGDVFESGNLDDLAHALERIVNNGKLKREERFQLAEWAKCLGADAGANYLLQVLKAIEKSSIKPIEPWKQASAE
tara:strand:+ start:9207 stop:10325 length:1119 start_codon:yes stop_codon:yes gene_type:complete